MAVTVVSPELGHEQRSAHHHRAGRTLLYITLAVLLGSIAFKAYRLTLPTDGWSLLAPVEMPTFGENLMRTDTPLLPGDVLLEVDGVPYFEIIGAAVQGRAAPLAYRAGTTASYTVWRGDAPATLEVPLAHWSLAGVARAAGRTLLDTPLGGVYLWLAWLLAAYVFYRRSANGSARLLFLLESVTLSIAISGMVAPVTVADTLSPTRFYAARIWGDLALWLLLPPLALHFLLLFPDAQRVARALLVTIYALPWLVFGLVWLTGMVVLVSLMSALYSMANLVVVVLLVVQHGSGAERARVRWLAFGFGASGAFSLLFWLHLAGLVPEMPVLSSLLFEHCLCDLIYVACVAVALVRHRLFDIDVIIRRTLVYGGLTLAVVGFYVGVVGGAGRLLGGEANWPLALAATGLVALAFDPLRSQLQRAANRLVYGYRDEPYLALAQLGQRLELTQRPATALIDAARAVAEVLRLPYVAVEVGGATLASHGEPRHVAERIAMTRAGEPLGALVVSPRLGEERMPKADLRLLSALASQVASAVHALTLEADLERSRLASLNAREEARRRLGSDLHDDVGHRLTALVHHAERLSRMVDSDPEGSKRSLETLIDEVKATALRVRSLAHQLHPPELALLGLVEATRERLAALGEALCPVVHLEVGAWDELPAAVELGAYSVVQEALSNVARHARATTCRVRFEVTSADATLGGGILGRRMLVLEISDDGVGLPENQAAVGLGLTSMRQRADELGGGLSLDTPPGGGTRVRLSVPLPDARQVGA